MSKKWFMVFAAMVAMTLGGRLSAQQPLADPSYGIGLAPPNQNELGGNVDQRLGNVEQRLQQLELHRLPAIEDSSEQRLTGFLADDEEDSLADRLKDLEGKWKKFEDGEKKKKADAAKKPTQKWSGRIHADYWGFPGDDPGSNFFERGNPALDIQDRVLFRRVRFGLAGDIGDTMLYKAEFDLNTPRVPQFKDVYIGWKELPVLRTLLLGNQKRPYGLDHLNSSRYNVFIERPYVVEAFNQDARRFGLCSYGVSDDESWNWRYGTYFSTDLQSDGAYLASDQSNGVGTHNYQMEVAGRLANTIWYDETSDGRGYAHWAVSGTVADTDAESQQLTTARFRTRPEARTSSRWIDTGGIAGADSYALLGLEGVVNVGPVQVVGEYMHSWVDRNGFQDVEFGGGYVYVSYFLTGEHMPWERESGTLGRVKPFEDFFLVNRCRGGVGGGWGAWQVAARYSYADFTDADVLGGIGSAFTMGLNWHWTPYSRMQFNYIYGRIDDRFAQNIGSGGVPTGAAGPTTADYHIIGTRFMVDY